MVYNDIKDIDAERINKRIKDAIEERGSITCFFDDIPYTKQSFYKCAREKSIPPLSVILEIAKKLDCDMGYLLCEYDEKRRVVADVKDATGLDEDVINIILNMKSAFLKLSALNDLLKDDYFLAIVDLLHLTDYHYGHCEELSKVEQKIVSDYKNAETSEEKEKLQKRFDSYTNEHTLHKAKAESCRYKLMVAFSRMLDRRFNPLPDIDVTNSEHQWKQEHPWYSHKITL